MVTAAPFDFRTEERFWKYVRLGPDCWEWTGATKTSRGGQWPYGNFCLGRGKHILAHRYSWSFAHGCARLPKGMYVCHRCDNPLCIKPDHLFLGTPGENNWDCIKKGRRSSITQSDIRAIRQFYNSGQIGTVSLGKLYGLSQAQTFDIVRGKSWAWVV